MKQKIFFSVILCLILLSADAFSQVRIKQLSASGPAGLKDSLFFSQGRMRQYTSFNGAWTVYLPENRDKRTTVSVPSNFRGEEELVYEKELKLTAANISTYNYQLYFMGISHAAEVSINGYVIYKHPGGEFPFYVDLPKDLIKTKRRNVLTVRVLHRFDSEATIPVKQRFLFPETPGGIFREVLLLRLPKTFISGLDFATNLYNRGRSSITVNTKVENRNNDQKNGDSLSSAGYSVRVSLLNSNGTDVLNANASGFTLSSRHEKFLTFNYNLASPQLWTPSNPQSYRLLVQLFRGDALIDEVIKPMAFLGLKSTQNSILLNDEPFLINGVTYAQSYFDYGNMASYSRMRSDMKAIRYLGFNAVRFTKSMPHPYLLELCREYGLLAFIELPVNAIPGAIASKGSFIERSTSYLSQMLKAYRDYSAVAAVGLGSSFSTDDPEQVQYISRLAAAAKGVTNKLLFASFSGFKLTSVDNLDFYGLEIFNRPMQEVTAPYKDIEASMGRGRVFISEATYATYMGSSNGYLNPFSYEAQAKFISDLLDFTWENRTSGYFINSMYDYRGAYASLTAGYSPDNLYHIGIVGEDRQLNRLSYKVIYSKLHDAERVTIPIGSRKDDAPLSFILIGVALALLMGLFINSRKKFREDATRALLRPYNFFADIRDQRLLSGFHSNFLMLILAVCSALLQVNLLYYYRANPLFEKLVLSFGSEKLVNTVSYLAWNPSQALLWLTLISMAAFITISIAVKTASLFLKNKVMLSSIYYTVVWSFLPLILLLPLGLILYKVLSANVLTVSILIALALFTLWVFYRLMKGIYVILDVNPAPVYFYTLGIIVFAILLVLIYFQLAESTVYYMTTAFAQY